MSYIEEELYRVSPFPVLDGKNGQFRMKITSGVGRQTKWINLTPQQFREIEVMIFTNEAFKESAE